MCGRLIASCTFPTLRYKGQHSERYSDKSKAAAPFHYYSRHSEKPINTAEGQTPEISHRPVARPHQGSHRPCQRSHGRPPQPVTASACATQMSGAKPDICLKMGIHLSQSTGLFLEIVVRIAAACNMRSVRRGNIDKATGVWSARTTDEQACRKDDSHSWTEVPLSTVLLWRVGAECWPA